MFLDLSLGCKPSTPYVLRVSTILDELPSGGYDRSAAWEGFAAVIRGEHALLGLRNRDLARIMFSRTPKNWDARRRVCACVTRLLQRLRAHGLIAEIPRSRPYRVTAMGYQIMGATIYLREEEFPNII
jgi:hypothetical protein